MRKNLLQHFTKSDTLQDISKALANGNEHFYISGVKDSGLSFYLAHLFIKTKKYFLVLAENMEQAAFIFNDLKNIVSEKDIVFVPSSYKKDDLEATDNAHILERYQAIKKIHTATEPHIFVSFPQAIAEKIPNEKEIARNTFLLEKGQELDLDFFTEILFEYGFQDVDFVSQAGEFSIRGGIVDVFSFYERKPFRVEFFGDEISRIRYFDITTQLTQEKNLQKISIVPHIKQTGNKNEQLDFLESFKKKSVICFQNPNIIFENIAHVFGKTHEKKNFTSAESFLKSLQNNTQNFSTIHTENFLKNFGCKKVVLEQTAQPVFYKNFDLLFENLKKNQDQNMANYICCSDKKQIERFREIFEILQEKNEISIQYKTLVLPLFGGFVDSENKLACYTDHQIFERYYKSRLKHRRGEQNFSLQSLNDLKKGDYVTHIDHGVGKFGGLQKIQVGGKTQEAIKLVYMEGDILYVSIHSLYKISKFSAGDGKPPKIFKLGSGAWKKLKQKTQKKVREIAFDLIQLYAKRKLKKGFAFGQDSYLQHELEASFLYEDTPDQYSATLAVKKDMESNRPMDRLICGDVGFGKTEVAIRAAFKAVDNSKQVAILVPTTILAFQHYKTFKTRLDEFGVSVDYLSRFRTAKEKTAILKNLQEGKIDIIIGTHQLTNKHVKFKDLGLLIVDEEQKFGVGVKDKLKTLKENIDTLTLTATPIPRTLQFSLMAARDLSVIRTPPPNRYPIETQIIRFQTAQITEAITYEISRGGQVFFIHNKIENIKEIALLLQKLLPEATIGIGHGQIEGKKLEQLMLDFIAGAYDILVATTIIESGLDVPNANTIFINNAHHFGLSDLHQMRGRVGRSNKKAFCYLITPTFHAMSSEAQKRIKAISLFSELGAGINIAMKDLEIRGAGDLLGGEQSGFINEMGFETYQQILEATVQELKEKEFKDLYEKPTTETFIGQTQLDTDFEILFPDDYINSSEERLRLYKKLGTLENAEELKNFKAEIVNRFGHTPRQVIDLLDSVKIKWAAKKLGIEKLVLKNKRMVAYFISDGQSAYYQSPVFAKILDFVQKHKSGCVLKEKQTPTGKKLLLTFIRIHSVQKALEVLKSV